MVFNFVFLSSKSSTYPWVKAGLGRLRAGRVKYWCASGFNSPAALLGSHFEPPCEAYLLCLMN
jgi:hypothetical protein